MPSRRSFVCGAVLLVACAAIVAHAADAPTAANKTAANLPAAANKAVDSKPAAANAANAAPAAKPTKSSSDSGKKKAKNSADDDDDPTPNGSDKYDKSEEGSGSSKGAKPKWKYLAPTIDATCTNPGDVCAAGICDELGDALQCAPGSVCTPICNNCQATCAAPLTCTGVKCPKYFQCEVGSITGNDDDTDAYVRCVPATSSVPTTCALGYVRVAATGACVRPSILKVQGGNVLSIGAPLTEVLKRAERPRANEVSRKEKEEAAEAAAEAASGAKAAADKKEPSGKEVDEGAKKAEENKAVEKKQ